MAGNNEAIFFDDGLGQLAPLTDLRPAFAVRCGALTNLRRVADGLGVRPIGLVVQPAFADLTRDRNDLPVNRLPDDDTPRLAINGRCPLPLREIDELEPGAVFREEESGHIIGAKVTSAQLRALLDGDSPEGVTDRRFPQQLLMSRPWHVRSIRDTAMRVDAELLTRGEPHAPPTGVTVIGEHRVVIDPSATIYPNVTLVAEEGPIVIGPGVVIRPGATLIGPVFVGRSSRINEHAVIRPHTAIGPSCKVAGEISGVVFQGYANKAHDGFLGDSWVGEWVNLGAATNNSNLLNTYSEVICQATPGGPRERTGETFLGAIIGDHVKTAIGTRIMTGSVLHTGSMFARSTPVSGCVAPFTWATDEGDRVYRFDKFMDVAQKAMSRRDIEPGEAYAARLRQLHAERDA
ncbi:MAG: hypothetical protein JJU33_05925 [Phycisphaerales bacterium]|nr:hypothetical protein [Phycisphaerales bacterium]